MKVWLNDLKEGDIFYNIILNKVYKCEHLGDAHNMNFRMSRIKFKILDKDKLFNENLLGDIHEAFVNQYVYDDYESAQINCIQKLKDELKTIKDYKDSIIKYKELIINLEAREHSLEETINNYEREYNKEN